MESLFLFWVSVNLDGSDSDDDNTQREWPLIFGFSGSEYKVFINYDWYRGLAESVIKYAGISNAIHYTEVGCALPVTQINCDGDDSDPLPLFDKLYQ